MKIKETYCDIFKNDVKEVILKENEKFELIEAVHDLGDLLYSDYYLIDKETNHCVMDVEIPNPKVFESCKDLYLKYQHGARRFFMEFFDVVSGIKDDIKSMYKTKQDKDLFYEESTYEDGTPIVLICTPVNNGPGRIVGAVTFPSQEKNLKIADGFIKLFEGVPVEESWGEICEQ